MRSPSLIAQSEAWRIRAVRYCMKLHFAPLFIFIAVFWCGAKPLFGQTRSSDVETACDTSTTASPFLPVDSWIYPAMLRLYSLGYVDTLYLGVRPWTRLSVSRMLDQAGSRIDDAEADNKPTAEQAREIYDAVNHELHPATASSCASMGPNIHLESVYSVMRGISGTPLRDSFHLGSTIVNDYGRPYEGGFNNFSGMSGYAIAGRFTLYLRGEFQGAPSAAGYPLALAQALSSIDGTTYTDPTTLVTNYFLPQSTIPLGPIGSATQGRFLEAYVSAQVLGHVISFGKQDEWLGPAEGASMAYSNNAENIYAFHINRSEPLYVPGLSRLTGPFRYEFLVGALRGHTLMPNPAYEANPSPNIPNVINPGNPWVHVEKINFRPTTNIELGFERTALFGGEGHSPVTLHTFLKSFFSVTNVSAAVKNGTSDPGARFGSFDFSYRLPFLRNWLTLYADSEVHDDVSPISAPRRSAYRPGIYLSHFPGMPNLDLRLEAASTDPSAIDVGTNVYGHFMYWEQIEKQGYTNQGQLFGDWIGREDKGGQAWMTYHLSGNEWIQARWRGQKATKDFIAGGTTLNNFGIEVAKCIGQNFEIDTRFTIERWQAPIYMQGAQTVSSTIVRLSWSPERNLAHISHLKP